MMLEGEHPITASAKMTAFDYMVEAMYDIDTLFGEGTAGKHPELVAAYIQTEQLRAGLDAVAEAIREAARAESDR
jgi:hypothetical protein